MYFLQVCDEVTEMQCEIVPYTECQMEMEVTPYKSYEMVPQIFKKKVCKEGMDVVQHTKMMPECRNVTKQNCITKWETDENGNQASDLSLFSTFNVNPRLINGCQSDQQTEPLARYKIFYTFPTDSGWSSLFMLDLQQIDLEGKRRVERIQEQGQDSFISYQPR